MVRRVPALRRRPPLVIVVAHVAALALVGVAIWLDAALLLTLFAAALAGVVLLTWSRMRVHEARRARLSIPSWTDPRSPFLPVLLAVCAGAVGLAALAVALNLPQRPLGLAEMATVFVLECWTETRVPDIDE